MQSNSEALISVIMPCYNSVKTLPHALASLIHQSYENWECIIVDDGSNDDPKAIVTKINDARIKYFKLTTNQGRGKARQVALSHCQGEFLAILDADDWYLSHKLERQLDVFLQNADINIVSMGMLIVDQDKNVLGSRKANKKNETEHFPPLTKPQQVPFFHAPSMVRMSLLQDVDFDPELLHAEDFDFFLQLALKSGFTLLHDFSYVYMEDSSFNYQQIRNRLVDCKTVFSKHHQNYPVSSRLKEVECLARQAAYQLLFTTGLHLKMRGRKTPQQNPHHEDFQSMQALISKTLSEF